MKKLILMILAFSLAKVAFAGAYQEVLTPPTYTQAECEATPNSLWVDAAWRESGKGKQASACLKYFPSENVAGASTALIFVDGDVYTSPGHDTSTYDILKAKNTEFANLIAKQAGLPVIRLARPGTFGSSGMSHVLDRRMPIETYLIDAAVTRLKERYGFHRIQLAGQSTGGGLVGGLMTLGRDDIDCAVISSGVTSVKTRSSHLNSPFFHKGQDETGHDLKEVYDPIDHVSGIVPDQSRRVFILADPRDEAVSFASQKEFHEKLIKSGISSTLLTDTAEDERHHILAAPAQRIAGWCKGGKTDGEIRELLKTGHASGRSA